MRDRPAPPSRLIFLPNTLLLLLAAAHIAMSAPELYVESDDVLASEGASPKEKLLLLTGRHFPLHFQGVHWGGGGDGGGRRLRRP